jgi:hypothetical protein
MDYMYEELHVKYPITVEVGYPFPLYLDQPGD